MRTNNQIKQKSREEPSIRFLKVYPKIRDNVFSLSCVPEIRLCGNWLQSIGFEYGRRIVVSLEPGNIQINLLPDQEESIGFPDEDRPDDFA